MDPVERASTNEVKEEQWKISGDCNRCRRQKYCSKHCRLHKAKEEAVFDYAVKKVLHWDRIIAAFENPRMNMDK